MNNKLFVNHSTFCYNHTNRTSQASAKQAQMERSL